MAHLNIGDKIPTITGDLITVDEELGEGGEGVVYKVTWRGKPYALKWYFKKPKPTNKLGELYNKKYENFKQNIDRGAPAPTFLWPLALTKRDKYGCFGYVMELRPQEYKELGQFLLNRVRFNSPRSTLNAMLNITLSFKLLHNNGYSYQDLNDGNFFFNPKDGSLKICDNDNVIANGMNLGILGKMGYMAPEIMAENYNPDSHSDRFSLAIILFMLMCKSHPLFGKRNDPSKIGSEMDKELYCDNPVFIFDPNDKSNRPDDRINLNPNILWPYYPECLRSLFVRAFDKSVMKNDGSGRQNRVIEKEWIKGIFKARHSLVTCPNCGKDVFIDLSSSSKGTKCEECSKMITRPPVVRTGEYDIPLEYNKVFHRTISEFEITGDDPTFDNIAKSFAIVAKPAENPNFTGLVNMSQKIWTKTSKDGKVANVKITNKDSVGAAIIEKGMKLNFGYFGSKDCLVD